MNLVGKICKSIGCPGFSYEKHGYCTTHADQAPKYTFVKLKERNPIYNTQRWKKLRAFFIKRNPVCNKCKIKTSRVVHHLKEARIFPELAFEMTNLEALCDTCHNRESQRESMKGRKYHNG
jgi:5-methylcytosine-specific restriction protein A